MLEQGRYPLTRGESLIGASYERLRPRPKWATLWQRAESHPAMNSRTGIRGAKAIRRISMLLRAATVLLCLCIGSAAHAAKRVALVIGNAAYRHAGELANTRNDAGDMAAALRVHGFEVLDGIDLDKAALERKIRDFAAALVGADVGVFFYAGHGLQISGTNYLVPIDAQLRSASALDFEMVRLDLVQRTMEREAPTNILFLDACRDNPLAPNLARAMGTRSADIGRGLAPAESGVGTLISFSTQPGNVALDGTARNSPFAGALIKHLRGSNDDLSAILIAVRNDVMRETQRRQVPWEHSALTGRFYFAPNAPTPPTPPGTPPPPRPPRRHRPQPSRRRDRWRRCHRRRRTSPCGRPRPSP